MFSMEKDVVFVTDSIDESVGSILPLRRCGFGASFVNTMHDRQAICTKQLLTITKLVSPCTNGYRYANCLTKRHTSSLGAKTSNLLDLICLRQRDVFRIEICTATNSLASELGSNPPNGSDHST